MCISRLKLWPAILILSISLFSCKSIMINKVINGYSEKNGAQFPVLLLEDEQGKLVDVRKLEDSVILVNTWGTWCSPCINEIPDLNNLNEKLQKAKGIKLVNICISSKKDEWLATVKKEKLQGLNLFMPDSLEAVYMTALGLDDEGLPYNLFIGPDRKVLGGRIGIDANGNDLWAIYMLMQAKKNIDATRSAKEFITLFGKVETKNDPEVDRFIKFLTEYADKKPGK